MVSGFLFRFEVYAGVWWGGGKGKRQCHDQSQMELLLFGRKGGVWHADNPVTERLEVWCIDHQGVELAYSTLLTEVTATRKCRFPSEEFLFTLQPWVRTVVA